MGSAHEPVSILAVTLTMILVTGGCDPNHRVAGRQNTHAAWEIAHASACTAAIAQAHSRKLLKSGFRALSCLARRLAARVPYFQ